MGDDESSSTTMIKIGPVGSISRLVSAWDEKGHNDIVQIFVSHSKTQVNSIQFQYAENGSLVLSQRHGANGGNKFDVVKLDHPKEFITWISGHKAGSVINGPLCSITFGTNHGEYGPFGGFVAHDEELCFNLGQHRQFGGFHGTADDTTVKAIGVYLYPNITTSLESDDDDHSLNNNKNNVIELL